MACRRWAWRAGHQRTAAGLKSGTGVQISGQACCEPSEKRGTKPRNWLSESRRACRPRAHNQSKRHRVDLNGGLSPRHVSRAAIARMILQQPDGRLPHTDLALGRERRQARLGLTAVRSSQFSVKGGSLSKAYGVRFAASAVSQRHL